MNDSFKKILKQRLAEGQSSGLVTVIKKSGKRLACEITSVIFIDEEGVQNAITTITDTSESIRVQKNIDEKKEKVVAENIVLAKSKQKIIDIKNKKLVAHNISIAKVRQKKLDTKNEKIIAKNIILAQVKSDERLIENNVWIKYIAKTSYDVMWDWDIGTGEIYVGDSIEEIFGYKVKNNTVNFKDFEECLQPEEKETIINKLNTTLASTSKNWKDSYLFKRRNGSLAYTTSRASIIRDEDGKAIRLIGAIHDISRVQELESKLEEKIAIPEIEREKFIMATKISLDVIWDWKIFTNEIFIGEGFEELFGYTIYNNIGDTTAWIDHIHPDDKETVKKGFLETLESTAAAWQYPYRYIKADGSITKVFNRASIFRDADGKAFRVMGVIQDISHQIESIGNKQLLADKKNSLIEKIKHVVMELFQKSDEPLQTNFSDYLSQKLEYDYNYLSNLFSEMEGISIRQFIITQKILRAKELIIKNELTLTQIAVKLHYSSIAHLSNQFKKITGITPSNFKDLHYKTETAFQNA